MTQAPATPEFGDIVENGWASEENPTRKGYFVRSFKRIGRMNPGLTWEVTDRAGRFWEVQPRIIGDRLTVTPQADALEAQQARIAELEGLNRQLEQSNTEMFALVDAHVKATAGVHALADRYEKALREISDLADECVVFDAENVAAVEAAPDKAAASPGFSVLRYWNERLKLSKSWKRRIDEIRDQALSSQGRHEGGDE